MPEDDRYAHENFYLSIVSREDKLDVQVQALTAELDRLERCRYFDDTYSEKQFLFRFKSEKSSDVRAFICSICVLIHEKDLFTSVTAKEAGLLNSINEALTKKNIELGQAALMQLSTELQCKEKLLEKQEKNNKIATLISVVGIILTVIFGILSLVM